MIHPLQPRIQGLDALRCQLILQPGTHRRVGRRDIKTIERGADIETRATNQDRLVSAGPNAAHVQTGLQLVCRDAGLLTNVQDVELMVGDSPALLDRGLGGADVHAAVELHGIGVDDLAVQLLSEGEGKIRLAAGRRPNDRNHWHDRRQLATAQPTP
jgi:hypothetical protein